MNNTTSKIQAKIPTYVLNVADIIISNGYQAYLVGGSVRDILLGKTPKDYDIGTDASPDIIKDLFVKSIDTGAKFGTIIVVSEDEHGEKFDVEVTTFRSESDYFGGRWPGKVEFTKTIDEDLARRDFTINALAADLSKYDGSELEIYDIFGGIDDIHSKVIKAVGDPVERFSEDGLRTIRACRFASVLGFEIEENTFSAISKCLQVTKMVSVERVRDELLKIIYNSSKPSVGFHLLDKSGILELFIPELVEAKKFDQPEFHEDNVFEHSLKSMDKAEDEIKIAALFHDIGKIATQTKDEKGTHYYGHDMKGAEMTEKILDRLRFPKKEIKDISNLIRWHMFYYPSGDWRKTNEINKDALQIKENEKLQHGWTDSAIRRFLKNIGGQEEVDKLLKLRIADATSNPKSTFSPDEVDSFSERIAAVVSEDMALKISDLDINGKDLQEIGINPGPQYKEILEYLLEMVLEDPLLNKKEKLIELTQKFLAQKS